MKMIGFVQGPLFGPYLYMIVASELVYIGETQHHPVIRWGNHLQPNGSFLASVRLRGDPEKQYNNIIFTSIFCKSIIEEFGESETRIATQALEHEIHSKLVGNPVFFGRQLKVISDTQKTAPRRFTAWGRIHKMVPEILDQFKIVMEKLDIIEG
ncbi:MAG: hypothetical protein U1F76_19245 [Candidatus Competibacteraceae bacterium]